MNHLPTTPLVAIAVPAFASGDVVLTLAALVTLVFGHQTHRPLPHFC